MTRYAEVIPYATAGPQKTRGLARFAEGTEQLARIDINGLPGEIPVLTNQARLSLKDADSAWTPLL